MRRSWVSRFGTRAGWIGCLALAAVFAVRTVPAQAQGSSTWTSGFSDTWSDVSAWQNGAGPIADGVGATGDFSTIGLGTNITVTIDGSVASRTLGTLLIGDTGQTYWLQPLDRVRLRSLG